MLSSEQMLKIDKGWLVTHKDWHGVWVVDERENQYLYVIPVNSDYVDNKLTLFVDDIDLHHFKV